MNKFIIFYLILLILNSTSSLPLSFLNFKTNYMNSINNCSENLNNCSTDLNNLEKFNQQNKSNDQSNRATVFNELIKDNNGQLGDNNHLKFNITDFINSNLNFKSTSKINSNINSGTKSNFNSAVDLKTILKNLNLNKLNQPDLNELAPILNYINLKSKKDIDLEEGIKLKCYLNIIRSFEEINFIDVLLVRRDRVQTNWYRKNKELCKSLLEYKFTSIDDYRFFPGLIELKYYKLRLMFFLIKWKVEQIIKFNIWFLVIIARIKQAILGKSIIRDEDINLLIRLFYPELFSLINNH